MGSEGMRWKLCSNWGFQFKTSQLLEEKKSWGLSRGLARSICCVTYLSPKRH